MALAGCSLTAGFEAAEQKVANDTDRPARVRFCPMQECPEGEAQQLDPGDSASFPIREVHAGDTVDSIRMEWADGTMTCALMSGSNHEPVFDIHLSQTESEGC
jgi:hypothetical protein